MQMILKKIISLWTSAAYMLILLTQLKAFVVEKQKPRDSLAQCFSTAVPRPGIFPWHQIYRAAKGSPGICYFNFLSIFHNRIFNKCNDVGLRKLQHATRFH
jgi:hypothetical protein